MNRLQLVQELCRLAGITDTGGPTTTLSQTGDFAKAVKYIDMALEEIQLMYFDWNFLWAASTITTSVGTSVYQGQSDLGIWDAQRVRYGNRRLDVIDYRDYEPDSNMGSGPPDYLVIRPDNKVLVVPTPDDEYVISYDYFKKPRAMTQNNDQPLIPSEYRMVIVGRALMLYGNFESSEDAKIQGQELYEQYIEPLIQHETPRKGQMQGRAENQPIVVVPV